MKVLKDLITNYLKSLDKEVVLRIIEEGINEDQENQVNIKFWNDVKKELNLNEEQ